MHVTGDQYLIKKLNKSIVLDTIIRNSPVSRAQISELTGLNKGTVSTMVSELIGDDLVYEIGPGQSSGGRKPVMMLFNKNAGYAIGVDLGVNYILSVLTDLQGNIVKESNVHIDHLSFDQVINKLKESIRLMFQSVPSSTYGIVGIGIGVPGIVDDRGTILFAPNLEWENVDLSQIINEEFHVPVIIDNEANAGALGEKLYGTGKEVSNLVYVSVGGGIGTGIIIENELYKGTSGFSGEIGHTIIEANGKKCRCGNRGCWELYASENALLQQAQSLPIFQNQLPKEFDIDSLIELANEGSPDVINLFNTIGEYLGLGLTNIINTFNPDLIIIGNQMTKAEKWLTNPVRRVVETRSLPFHRKQLRIEFSSLSLYSCALGASSFAVTNFFADSKVSIE